MPYCQGIINYAKKGATSVTVTNETKPICFMLKKIIRRNDFKII